MQNLSDIKNKRDNAKEIYDSGYLKVMEFDNYHFVKEKNMLICIPYFVEDNTILLRYENIPTYNYIYPEIEKYVTVMSESFEENETPIEVLKRGLKEEFGLLLKKKEEDIDILTPIFNNKGNCSQYYICILPLMSFEYEQIEVKGDGSKHEETAQNIILGISDLKNVIVHDLISKYTLDIFKNSYSLL
jgi:hypothetical protein